MSSHKPYLELCASGAVSGALYSLLYLYEDEVMENLTRTDGFYPALPILTAFVFSIAHGAFTAYFWEAVGIRALRKD